MVARTTIRRRTKIVVRDRGSASIIRRRRRKQLQKDDKEGKENGNK